MNSQRARAYGRVTRTLSELGPAKLLPEEQARIREAADALLFSTRFTGDQTAVTAFFDVCTLREHLVESERWTAERAGRLLDDVWGCGPALEAWLAPAA
jgi:hypothetical protein